MKTFEQSNTFGKIAEHQALNILRTKIYTKSKGYFVEDTSDVKRKNGLAYPDVTVWKNNKILVFFDTKNKSRLYFNDRYRKLYRPSFSCDEKIWDYRKISINENAPCFLLLKHPHLQTHFFTVNVKKEPWFQKFVNNEYGKWMLCYDFKQVKKLKI